MANMNAGRHKVKGLNRVQLLRCVHENSVETRGKVGGSDRRGSGTRVNVRQWSRASGLKCQWGGEGGGTGWGVGELCGQHS